MFVRTSNKHTYWQNKIRFHWSPYTRAQHFTGHHIQELNMSLVTIYKSTKFHWLPYTRAQHRTHHHTQEHIALVTIYKSTSHWSPYTRAQHRTGHHIQEHNIALVTIYKSTTLQWSPYTRAQHRTGHHIQEHNIANSGRISQPAMNAELFWRQYTSILFRTAQKS